MLVEIDDRITWESGLLESPDGLSRQIPQKHSWCQAVWITLDGAAARKRFYNAVSKTWTWGDLLTPTEDEDFRVGYYLEWFTPIDRAIALAWSRRRPGCTRLDAEDPTYWKEGEDDITAKRKGETWQSLRWHIGLYLANPRFKISSLGRLKAPDGKITSGFWFDGRRWAGIPELVDLTSASKMIHTVTLPPRVNLAADSLLSGATPDSLASELGVSVKTGWQYFTMGAQHVPKADLLKALPTLVHPQLIHLLRTMQNLADKRLGSSLTELMQVAENMLPWFRSFALKWEHLRFARLCILA